VNAGNIESDWPPDHTHLYAFMAPRVEAPAAPSLVPSRDGDTTRIELASESPVPVERFLLFSTHSAAAARSAASMGPPFAKADAAPVAGPPTATGQQRYAATWTGVLPQGWEPLFLRAVAIPTRQIPAQGLRGVPSEASAAVTARPLPSLPPDLDELQAEDWDETLLAVHTATSAQVAATSLGPHALSASAQGGTAIQVRLDELPVADDPKVPPANAGAVPIPVRSAAPAGRTQLTVWFRRAHATETLHVRVLLSDPLGRVTERTRDIPPQ
jgi:hypothetical protein